MTAYAERLRQEADRHSVGLGIPRWDDDFYEAKLDLLCAEHVPVVSITFGCPPLLTVLERRTSALPTDGRTRR